MSRKIFQSDIGSLPRKTSLAIRFAEVEDISIGGITDRMSPVGLHVYAEAYLSAAQTTMRHCVSPVISRSAWRIGREEDICVFHGAQFCR